MKKKSTFIGRRYPGQHSDRASHPQGSLSHSRRDQRNKALDLANSEPVPDLILLDVMMPGMDGFEVCTRLKADSATREIPVIFLTGQTEVEDETRGFEVGGVDYIHKPFSQAVVKARVQTHLVLRGIREQLASNSSHQERTGNRTADSAIHPATRDARTRT